MIVLDTDVLSAVMKPELEPQVAIWLGGQSTTDILITTPTICEILYVTGRIKALMKEGKKLDEIKAAKPSAEFDEKWGKAFISPNAFVEMLFAIYS